MANKTKKKKSETAKAPFRGLWVSRIWRFIRNLFILFFIVSIAWVAIDRFVPVYFTPLMGIRSVESIFNGETPKISKQWVSIDEISPNMVQAVVASEDNLFLTHHGFSFTAISKAIDHNQNNNMLYMFVIFHFLPVISIVR